MIKYTLNHSDKGIFVQLEKDYNLHIKKEEKCISVQKSKINTRFSKIKNEHNPDSLYSLNGCISASDIYAELANIKHIGFEVTDSCNLQCTYCIYGDFYNNHDARTNK